MRLQRASVPGRDWMVLQIRPLDAGEDKTGEAVAGATIVACYDNEAEARAAENHDEGRVAARYLPRPATPPHTAKGRCAP